MSKDGAWSLNVGMAAAAAICCVAYATPGSVEPEDAAVDVVAALLDAAVLDPPAAELELELLPQAAKPSATTPLMTTAIPVLKRP
jgi:hypothetical protein